MSDFNRGTLSEAEVHMASTDDITPVQHSIVC